ncbi:MAG: polysaccharide biosynthesis tyrosine autokinase [Lentisphaerae bacterium]|nr:polysaccharide biosynthesis tyrosine autokinase [Lentisphaerota bacterium]
MIPWRDLLFLVWERRWVAATVFVIITTVTALWTFRQEPRYQATARLQVDMARQNVLNMPDIAGTEPFFLYNHYVNTLVREIKSQTFAERVAAALDKAGCPTLPDEPARAVVVMRAVDAKPVKDSRLIDITAEHADPNIAAQIANTTAEQFIRQNLDRRSDAASEAVAWLSEQVESQRQKLSKSENALRDYRDKTRTVSLEQRQDIVVAKLKAINEALTAAEMEGIAARTGWQALEENWASNTNPQSIAVIATDPIVSAVREQLLSKRADVSALTIRYKAGHPAMKQAQNELTELEQKFTNACEEARVHIRARYTLAQANEEALRQALRLQEEQALSLDRLLMQYDELKRNADADRDLYDALLTRLKETDVAGKLETNNLRLIDRAHVPENPFKPNKVANVTRGALGGLVLGLMLSLVVHLGDDRVRRLSGSGLGTGGAPLLAVIPRIEAAAATSRARVTVENPDSAPAEAFRSLRANLMLSAPGRQAKRILITGTGSGDGKSLVAANLAIVLASNGERVLLMDGDLRRPAVRRAFDCAPPAPPHPLIDDVSVKDAVVHTVLKTLDLLAPEGALPNAAELLASPRFDRMLKETDGYDRVIIDCPPLFSVSDPLLLLPHVDGVIVVARYKKTRHGPVADALQRLQSGKATVLGLVLNSVTPREHEYYYSGYSSYYGSARRPRTWWRRLLASPQKATGAAPANTPVR